jgi:hypothetical protein
MKVFALLVVVLFPIISSADCFDDQRADIEPQNDSKTIRIADFLIHSADFSAITRQEKVFVESQHFLQTELGWRFPATRKEMNRAVLEVHFVPADRTFTGTVKPGPVVILNQDVLRSPEFSSIWIHYLTHASELMYRSNGERWIYEATAGWMESQFSKTTANTRVAQLNRLIHPGAPIDDPVFALGASRFLDVVSRPYRDVIRQTWEQWSFASDERVLDVLTRVLQLNHLPSLDSYLVNYFLRTPSGIFLNNDSTTSITINPYSAAVVQGIPNSSASGGLRLEVIPRDSSVYSASLIYYGAGEKEGTLAIKQSIQQTWSTLVPFHGMARYKLILVNSSKQAIRGTVVSNFDSTIPAVLQYFRANPGEDGGVQLEWKTARENGVAFWNLYRVTNGSKERLNAFPIPASIDSSTGVHYIFMDSVNGAFYSLEALTGEGFQSSIATTELSP